MEASQYNWMADMEAASEFALFNGQLLGAPQPLITADHSALFLQTDVAAGDWCPILHNESASQLVGGLSLVEECLQESFWSNEHFVSDATALPDLMVKNDIVDGNYPQIFLNDDDFSINEISDDLSSHEFTSILEQSSVASPQSIYAANSGASSPIDMKYDDDIFGSESQLFYQSHSPTAFHQKSAFSPEEISRHPSTDSLFPTPNESLETIAPEVLDKFDNKLFYQSSTAFFRAAEVLTEVKSFDLGLGTDHSQVSDSLGDAENVNELLRRLGEKDALLSSSPILSPVSYEEVDSILSRDSSQGFDSLPVSSAAHLSTSVALPSPARSASPALQFSRLVQSAPSVSPSLCITPFHFAQPNGSYATLSAEYLQRDVPLKAESGRASACAAPYNLDAHGSEPRRPEERRLKKKEQNKTAALRYRQKKREEKGVVLTEVEVLEQKNATLKERADELSKEINYLKGLLDEIQKQ
jgi:hypothetical protein